MLKKRLNNNKTEGQALVTLLFFTVIGMIIISAAAAILYTNRTALAVVEQGTYAYYTAESGIEEALIRMIRNSYTGGTLDVGQGSANVQVQNGVITSTGTFGNAVRRIQVETAIDENGIKVVSWKEVN